MAFISAEESVSSAEMDAFLIVKKERKRMKKEGQVRIPSGCAISAVISRKGERMSGEGIMKSMVPMHERSNGLGGGFAAYGIYPEYRDFYAFHVFFEDDTARRACEAQLRERFEIVQAEPVPVHKVPQITDVPLIWRYFLAPLQSVVARLQIDEKEYVARTVMHLNTALQGVYVFSSGKNMGTFKAVGYPEDVGRFYRLDSYAGYCWTAHGRYPTNTPGWWGGAHPFTLLDYSVVHNGEISSYDANRRYMEMFGYRCNLQTDTEVITYLFDLLVRRHGFSQKMAAHIMAAPSWDAIDRMEPSLAAFETALRCTYSDCLVNGPFSVILGSEEGLLALNDRLKLRALMVGEKGSMVYLASEQASIELVCPDVENVRSIEGGEPFVVQLDEVARKKAAAPFENQPDLKPSAQFTGVMPAENKRGEA